MKYTEGRIQSWQDYNMDSEIGWDIWGYVPDNFQFLESTEYSGIVNHLLPLIRG